MSRPPTPGVAAYSLVELVIVLAIVGFLATGAWRVISNDWQRARLNGVSGDFAAWVEGIRKAAQRTQGGCEITVSALSNAADRTQLAVVRNLGANDSACASRTSFLFQAASGEDRLSSFATTSVFAFTPRGTILGSGNQALPNQVEVRLALRGIQQLRCIRLSGLLGAIDVGSHSSTADVRTSCPDYGRF